MSHDERLTVVIGDSLVTLRFPIEDAEGKAVDLTGGAVRIFPNGVTSDDRPTDTGGGNPSKSGVVTTAGSTSVTMTSTTGLVAGMRMIHANVPEGTEITSVTNSTTLVMNRKALASGSGLTATFWHGLLCDITEAANGIAKIQGLPAALHPGALTLETYRYDLRYQTAGGKIGYSVPDEFDAVTPVY